MVWKRIYIYPFKKNLSQLRSECYYSLTTSKMEALGRITLEAMLAGNVVVGTDTGGTLELIGENQERGYLYKQGDYRDLAKVMKTLIDSNSDDRDLLLAAQDFVRKYFDLYTYSKKIFDVYKEVISTYNFTEEKKSLLQSMEERYNRLSENYNIEEINQRNSIAFNNKFKRIFEIENRWLSIRQSERTLNEYFHERNIKKIAIYGMGDLGCRFYDEINKESLDIAYVIDKNHEYISDVMEVKYPEDELEDVDMLVVTLSVGADKVIRKYKEKYSFECVSLVDIINSYAI